jgi:hypothetical protein
MNSDRVLTGLFIRTGYEQGCPYLPTYLPLTSLTLIIDEPAVESCGERSINPPTGSLHQPLPSQSIIDEISASPSHGDLRYECSANALLHLLARRVVCCGHGPPSLAGGQHQPARTLPRLRHVIRRRGKRAAGLRLLQPLPSHSLP